VPLILIIYSFGGLVLKSLMVEAHKHEDQISKNTMDEVVQKRSNYMKVIFSSWNTRSNQTLGVHSISQ